MIGLLSWLDAFLPAHVGKYVGELGEIALN